MKNLFYKYGFKTSFSKELIIERELFIKKLSESIEYNNYNFITDFIESFPFTSKKLEKRFEGEVINNYFRIRRNFKPSYFNRARSTAQGQISTKNDKWIVTTKINGFDYRFVILYLLLLFSILGLTSNFMIGILGIIVCVLIIKTKSKSMKKDLKILSKEMNELINQINKK